MPSPAVARANPAEAPRVRRARSEAMRTPLEACDGGAPVVHKTSLHQREKVTRTCCTQRSKRTVVAPRFRGLANRTYEPVVDNGSKHGGRFDGVNMLSDVSHIFSFSNEKPFSKRLRSARARSHDIKRVLYSKGLRPRPPTDFLDDRASAQSVCGSER